MWGIIVVNQKDNDLLFELPKESFEEVISYFTDMRNKFSKFDKTVFCSSGIHQIESYDKDGQRLSIHYHIDNEDKIFKITKAELW